MKNYILLLTVCMIFLLSKSVAQQVTITDSRHYSNVFGEIRNFRVFLPPGYGTSDKRYPVIYFFHGWGQRYFGEGSEEYAGYDSGDQNKGDNIANFVSRNDVIVVKADGYNRRPDEEYYRRPYNVLPVETYRQFPIYFPELVQHIDNQYRTLANRQNRAVSGLSMGGFMTFFLAAKYPHMVSSAGSFCGAPEFTIGPYDFPVEYKHMDMYKNLQGINVRLHYGDKDFIRSYHNDMNRTWPQLMDNYAYAVYDAEHSTCGLGDMFRSIMQTFQKPVPMPSQWHHTEVYPEFEVWDYRISTDRTVPGFTVLENVDKRGFKIAVREFVPDGQLIQQTDVHVTTAPLYEKNQQYTINDFDQFSGKATQSIVTSDQQGRLQIKVNGSLHHIGINKKTDKAEVAIAKYDLHETGWAAHGKENKISLALLNKGMAEAKNVSATVTLFRKNGELTNNTIQFGNINVNQQKTGNTPFIFRLRGDSVDIVKFRVDIQEGGSRWTQFIDVPVKPAAGPFKEIVIADGRSLSVVSSGIDVETTTLGKGNGDGVANPGESIVVLVKDSGKLWRTNLAFSDKYINPGGVTRRRSDWWTDMDHVGASAKYDELLIVSDCPQDHSVELFGEYWTAEYPMHHLKTGTLKLNITGKDQTPPSIEHVQFRGDNTIEAKIIDGGNIKKVDARLNLQYELNNHFTIELKDDGRNGDRAAGDRVYSVKIPDKKFTVYRVIVSAVDDSGNVGSKEEKLMFVAH
jgi:S-formylglutathione hydrolase FrmB